MKGKLVLLLRLIAICSEESDLVREIIEALKPIISALKETIEYLISEPIVAFSLGFLLMLVAIREVFSRGRGAPFSVKTATVIALALALYGASTIAAKLPLMGRLAAYALVIGIPFALLFKLFGRRS